MKGSIKRRGFRKSPGVRFQKAFNFVLFLVAVGPCLSQGLDSDSSSNLSSPFRWDRAYEGQDPIYQLFSTEYPAGFFKRPAGLTLDNWFWDGHLRTYALMNLDEVLRTQEIRRGHGPVYMFGSARIPCLLDNLSITMSGENFPEEDTPISLRELYEWGNGQAILVVRNGKVIFEEYSAMDPGHRHHWMSVSKSITNIILGKLVSEKKIDLKKQVQDYIPALKGKGYGSFTVQELADMDADVDCPEVLDSPKWIAFCQATGWFSDPGIWPGGVKQVLPTINRLEKPKGEAGEKVRYTSASTQVLAWIIETIVEQPLTEYVEKNIWWHIGAMNNANVTVDKHGVLFAGGGYSSTLRDLARYGEIWANSGIAPDGTRIFSSEWMIENTSGKGPKIFRDYRYHNQSYSKGTFIAHQGHSGQMLWVNTASGTIVASFGSLTYPLGINKWSARAQLLLAERIDEYLQNEKIAESRK